MSCTREKDCPGEDGCSHAYCIRNAEKPVSCQREKECEGSDACIEGICVRYYDESGK